MHSVDLWDNLSFGTYSCIYFHCFSSHSHASFSSVKSSPTQLDPANGSSLQCSHGVTAGKQHLWPREETADQVSQWNFTTWYFIVVFLLQTLAPWELKILLFPKHRSLSQQSLFLTPKEQWFLIPVAWFLFFTESGTGTLIFFRLLDISESVNKCKSNNCSKIKYFFHIFFVMQPCHYTVIAQIPSGLKKWSCTEKAISQSELEKKLLTITGNYTAMWLYIM